MTQVLLFGRSKTSRTKRLEIIGKPITIQTTAKSKEDPLKKERPSVILKKQKQKNKILKNDDTLKYLYTI